MVNSNSTRESWCWSSGNHAGQGELYQKQIKAKATLSQVSILASQAPTNPDLDVEEEAAERQSLAAQTNGTTPADLQISCKSCKGIQNHISFLQHLDRSDERKKWSYQNVSLQQSIWLRRRRSWTSLSFAGNLSFPLMYSHRSHWRHTRCKKKEWNLLSTLLNQTSDSMSLSFSARRWVLEHAS